MDVIENTKKVHLNYGRFKNVVFKTLKEGDVKYQIQIIFWYVDY